MDWIDMLDDPRSVRAIYGEEYPSLDRVVLHEIRAHRDGPRVTLVVDLPDFPEMPPKKWVAQQFNTVQIELTVSGVSYLTIENMDKDSIVDVELVKVGDEIRVATSPQSSSRIHIRGRWLSVNAISAYLDGARRGVT
jgi:hypothetical protein